MKNKNSDIEKNIKAHNKVAKKYKKLHTEIYNEIEQGRLKEKLIYAKSLVQTENKYIALDYGCGDGNLTKHLLNIGFNVTSADISTSFLNLIENNLPLAKTLLLNGEDLSEIQDNSFDFICTYSVLHHIPDYLKAIKEMKRVLKSGGVIFLEHESSPNFWTNSFALSSFYKEVNTVKQKIKKFFYLPNYYHKFIQTFFDKKHSAEGDIHVFKEQHLNWDKILQIINENEFSKIEIEDYLLFKGGYKKDIYEKYKNKLNDTRLLIAVKK